MSVALVTGTSSGIGRATALQLHAQGLVVYATARNLASVSDLAAEGIHTLALDVTDEVAMTAAVAAIEAEHGAVDVLVNNAGFELVGPVEEVRKLFDTNVFGLIRLTQLVLPAMRRRGSGRIVNVASIDGRLAVPGGAFYGARASTRSRASVRRCVWRSRRTGSASRSSSPQRRGRT